MGPQRPGKLAPQARLAPAPEYGCPRCEFVTRVSLPYFMQMERAQRKHLIDPVWPRTYARISRAHRGSTGSLASVSESGLQSLLQNTLWQMPQTYKGCQLVGQPKSNQEKNESASETSWLCKGCLAPGMCFAGHGVVAGWGGTCQRRTHCLLIGLRTRAPSLTLR